MLFHVYKEEVPEGHYLNEPTGIYKTLLDADWVMYVLLPMLLLIVVLVLMYAWRLHEIPKHKAEKKKMRQAEVVSALTLLGLFEHWVWAIALFIAFVDWDAMEDTLTRILRNSRVDLPAPPAEAAAVVAHAVAAIEEPEVATPAPPPAEEIKPLQAQAVEGGAP